MADCGVPLTEKLRKSKSNNEDTFHQNVKVPGPATGVETLEFCPAKTGPLCPEATPSCEILVSPCQPASPLVLKRKKLAGLLLVEFNARFKSTVGTTSSVALELVVEPTTLPTCTL